MLSTCENVTEPSNAYFMLFIMLSGDLKKNSFINILAEFL